MKIQLELANPYQISQGLARDVLELTILDPDMFFSARAAVGIKAGKSDTHKLPRMMPNSQFTETFKEITENANQFTLAATVGNFFVNLLLSGAMGFLWGLLHCMQIISHFALVNIMMPANAEFLFDFLAEIATLNLVPSEPMIESIEGSIGIVNDDFYLTDSFIDFEFDSSGPIRNLQIMFIALLVLVFLPICLLLLRLLFFWSDKMTKFIKKVNDKLFFNIYIRFGLECYLELCLSSMIRFKNFNNDTYSDRFHSTFATMIFVAVLLYAGFSLVFLQLRFASLNNEESTARFGDLYLGVKTKDRTAVLFPFVFMLRRLLYASILVFWSQQNYFQIQTIIFKCSLIMIYTGYFRPFSKRLSNWIELMNDALTVLCSYFLIIFSNVVSDPYTRYVSGWPLIGLVCFIILINLLVIMYQGF